MWGWLFATVCVICVSWIFVTALKVAKTSKHDENEEV